MTDKYRTKQEGFWAGEFGNDYIERNQGEQVLSGRMAMLTKILSRTGGIKSVLELGANIGLNLTALRHLLPEADLTAVEINEQAVKELRAKGRVKQVIHSSILEFEPEEQWDMVFIAGVLIHINPEELNKVYDLMVRASQKYVMLCEYYNPTPVEVTYRGHEGRLFKRDFAGELWDRHPDLKLVDYGFTWRRDPVFPLDDSTWFLFEKT